MGFFVQPLSKWSGSYEQKELIAEKLYQSVITIEIGTFQLSGVLKLRSIGAAGNAVIKSC